MTLPNVNLSVRDGALGFSGANTDNVFCLIGPCSKKDVEVDADPKVYTLVSIDDVKTILGYGPLPELAAHILSVAGGQVLCVPTARTDGVMGDATASAKKRDGTAGSSPSLAMAGTPYDDALGIVSIETGGLGNAARFTYSLDFGRTVSAPRYMNGTGTSGSVTRNVGATSPAFSSAPTPGTYPATYKIKITTAGARGTAKFKVSTDGTTYPGAEILTAADVQIDGTSGPTLHFATGTDYAANDTYAWSQTSSIELFEKGGASTGITLTFAPGTYVASEFFSFSASGCSSSASAVNDAVDGVLASGLAFSGVVVHANPSTVGDARTISDSLQSKLDAYAVGKYGYCFGLVSGTTLFGDEDAFAPSVYQSVFDGPPSPSDNDRIMVTGGFETVVSSLTGRFLPRQAVLPIAARLASTPPQTHPGQFNLGSLASVTGMGVDTSGIDPLVLAAVGFEGSGMTNSDATELDNARIATIRTFDGVPGVYVARGVTLASQTSDYSSIMNRRVMDKACRITRLALLPYLNLNLTTKPDGKIDDVQAANIEADVLGKLETNLINSGNAVSASVQVDRTNNVLSTKELKVSISVQPYGYAETITASIGFATVG